MNYLRAICGVAPLCCGDCELTNYTQLQYFRANSLAPMSSEGESLEKALKERLNKLKTSHPRPTDLDEFECMYGRFLKTRGDKISWSKIEPPTGKLFQYGELEEMKDPASLMSKLVIVKLNGGLGTTMGCSGPKSMIKLRNNMNFLDITVKQLKEISKKYNCDLPLVLMNSFNTDKQTKEQKIDYSNVEMFNQSMYPRLDSESLLPIEDELYYPPGHGDMFHSMECAGILDKLLDQGKEYMFVSNIDNLAATVDTRIFNLVVEQEIDFCMELTAKTRADVKGGTLVNNNGVLSLLEIAQVPEEHKKDFTSVRKFQIFNTNSAWINLKAVKKVVKSLQLDLIQNMKSVGGRKVIQLETALGSAVKWFENNCGVVVPRNRFLPVKACCDLFLLESNLYVEREGFLSLNPARLSPQLPIIKLVGKMYQKVSGFEKAFPEIPDITHLDTLIVMGDVRFGKGVRLLGTVILCSAGDVPMVVKDDQVIEDEFRSFNHSSLHL